MSSERAAEQHFTLGRVNRLFKRRKMFSSLLLAAGVCMRMLTEITRYRHSLGRISITWTTTAKFSLLVC